MNKTDKEYVDAQIESVEEKFEARLKEAYEKVCNQNSLPKDPKGNVAIPAGFTQRDGQPLILIDPELFETLARKIVNDVYKAEAEYNKKMREEGKMTREGWYTKLYNNSAEYCAKVSEQVVILYNKVVESLEDSHQSGETIKSDLNEIKQTLVSVKGSSVDKHGVYIYGKHMAGCYFFTFMAFVFIFLGLFGYGFFEMKERAKQANVKLEVIRDEYGQVPAVKRTFEVLDSTFENPIPSKSK